MSNKTAWQKMIERANGGKDLETILIETYGREGNVEATARALGITSNTLRTWFDQFDLVPQSQLVKRSEAALTGIASA